MFQESLAVFVAAVAGSALNGLGPGALSLALSLIAGWLTWSPLAPEAERVPALFALGFSSALTVAIVAALQRWRRRGLDADALFKTVQDISTEGVVVYRAISGPDGEAVDFEYRYANPASCAIMRSSPCEVIGSRLLDRLPEARDKSELFARYARVYATGERSEAEYEIGGRWLHSTVAKLADGLVVTVRDITDHRRADDNQKLLWQELNHRVKNLLATVIAVVSYTERGAASAGELRERLTARLHALSRAHALLSKSAWTDASIGDVVRSTLAPHIGLDTERFHICGDKLQVSSDTALALNMALHELATNAAKYGALTEPDGKVSIVWEANSERRGFARLTWIERGGPVVSPPANKGFGTRLLGRAFAADGGEVKLEFASAGVRCEMSIPTTVLAGAATA